MRSRAKQNTLILREIFACYPDDTVLNFSDYESVYLNIYLYYIISLNKRKIMINMMNFHHKLKDKLLNFL